MENNMIMVTSASDFTVVVNVPDIPLNRVWKKRNAKLPVDRKALLQAYYDPSVEALFRDGTLITDDKEFLNEVGLLEDDGTPAVKPLTEAYLNRLIKVMPSAQVKTELKGLTHAQIDEVVSYAIEHYNDLQMDRIDILSAASGKNVMKAVEHYRLAQEE